jgi:hypothetical protein
MWWAAGAGGLGLSHNLTFSLTTQPHRSLTKVALLDQVMWHYTNLCKSYPTFFDEMPALEDRIRNAAPEQPLPRRVNNVDLRLRDGGDPSDGWHECCANNWLRPGLCHVRADTLSLHQRASST